MEVYWKESYNIILIMGRWALAAMRKQKGERARALSAQRLLLLHGLFRSNGKKGLLLQPDILGQHRQKDFVGGKEKKKSPYILWQAEMMLLRLFITVSTSRIVEALKRKSKRKRFGLCLLCCCCCCSCFWCRLIHNKLAAAMARACSPRMYFV